MVNQFKIEKMKTTNEEITTQNILMDLFCTAFEGGSNYWAEVTDRTPNAEGDSPSERWFNHITMDEGCMRVYDVESNDVLGLVTKERIENAFKLMKKAGYGNIVQAFLREDYDADTADMWFQYVVMEDIVFG